MDACQWPRGSVRVVPAGNTVRLRGLGGLAIVLVVGADAVSERWKGALGNEAVEAGVRYYVNAVDLSSLGGRLHVRPTCVPAFLVTHEGWPVDWFPPPPAGTGWDAVAAMIRARHADYDTG